MTNLIYFCIFVQLQSHLASKVEVNALLEFFQILLFSISFHNTTHMMDKHCYQIFKIQNNRNFTEL